MKLLITAGPTREPIDPVRFLTNRSSGKMGYALAEAALAMGHEVILVSGPVALSAPEKAETFEVETAQEMFDVVSSGIGKCDAAIFCAAVADYRVDRIEPTKIKKSSDELTLTLVKNPDILGSVRDQFRFSGVLVGFAAETDDVLEHAREKMQRKGCDLLVANDVSRSDIGFDREDNEVTLLFSNGDSRVLSLASKRSIGTEIIRAVEDLQKTKKDVVMPKWNRLVSILIPVFLVILFQVGKAESATNPVPGQVTKVRFDPLEMSLPIWIPSRHGDDEDRLWPVLLYYHGTNGSPTLRFAKNAAGGEDWILIGMSYLQKGRFSYQPEALRNEIDLYQNLLESWNSEFSLRLDPARVYVGGFSKGGWISGLFLEEDPRLAGAVILGAGHADRIDFDATTKSLKGKSAYFGSGESDGNFAMSFRGLRIYESMDAEVVWEFWEGLGHTLPAKVSPGLRQWFRIEGQRDASKTIQSDAIDWLEEQWASIQDMETGAEQWVALDELKKAPFFHHADRELLEEIRDGEAGILQFPSREREVEAKERFFEILEAESKNRFVETLRKAKQEYERLASEMPETYWGKRAATARDRCAVLLP